MEKNKTTIEILKLYNEFLDKWFSIIHKWESSIEIAKINKDTEWLKQIMQIIMSDYQKQEKKLIEYFN